ncbi:MAG: DUF5686 family protein [Bacteroidota bacterium]|nr:DUF5686 family protein [Bacteroidota bacterium]
MVRYPLFFILFFSAFLPFEAIAQEFRITGTVFDAETNAHLPYATVRVKDSPLGTTADREGRYTLILPAGAVIIVASHIGYTPAEKRITPEARQTVLDFALTRGRIELPEVIVTPGDNPALDIIRRAIEAKAKRRERLENYRLRSHTKLIVTVEIPRGAEISIRTPSDRRRVGNGRDSAASTTVILETLTEAVWAKPDHYKETILARKQTAQIPAQLNVLISSFLIVDFSSDILHIGGKAPIIGPISEAGLRHYDYTLKGTTTMDGERVHVIEIKPLSEYDPLLKGTVYVADGSFALAMVDVSLNDAALPPFVDTLRFRQHYRPFDDLFWMPVDVITEGVVTVRTLLDLDVHISGLSILQDYVINGESDKTVFDRTRIKVLKEADSRDSLFWVEHRRIPTDSGEERIYRVADSLKAESERLRNRWGLTDMFLGHTLTYGGTRWRLPGILELYRFNRVEGHTLHAVFSIERPFPLGERLSLAGGYGFGSRRWVWSAKLDAAVSHALRWSIEGMDRTAHLEPSIERLGILGTTLSNIFDKYDDKDYYRERGVKGSISYDILSLFPTTLSASRIAFSSCDKKEDWSLFLRDRPARSNPAINDGWIFGVGLETTIDARDFIDNAGEIQRIGRTNHTPRIAYSWNRTHVGGKTWTFNILHASLKGRFEMGLFGTFAYTIEGTHALGDIPRQNLPFLTGSIPYIASGRFRTLRPLEYGGDRLLTCFLEHDFGDILFRRLRIPFLQGSGWGFLLFANAGWSDITEGTRALQPVAVKSAREPYVEGGFGIDRILLLFRVDFAWRLTHFRSGSNFFVGISSLFLP